MITHVVLCLMIGPRLCLFLSLLYCCYVLSSLFIVCVYWVYWSVYFWCRDSLMLLCYVVVVCIVYVCLWRNVCFAIICEWVCAFIIVCLFDVCSLFKIVPFDDYVCVVSFVLWPTMWLFVCVCVVHVRYVYVVCVLYMLCFFLFFCYCCVVGVTYVLCVLVV